MKYGVYRKYWGLCCCVSLLTLIDSCCMQKMKQASSVCLCYSYKPAVCGRATGHYCKAGGIAVCCRLSAHWCPHWFRRILCSPVVIDDWWRQGCSDLSWRGSSWSSHYSCDRITGQFFTTTVTLWLSIRRPHCALHCICLSVRLSHNNC